MAFGAPDDSQFKPQEHEGTLVLVLAHRYLENVQTSFGVKDAIDAEIVLLDGPKAGTRIPTGRIFGLKMLGQLRGKVGQDDATLGRIGKGVGKPGQNPPWELSRPTEDDIKLAMAWEQRNGELRQPKGTQPQPQPSASDSENWRIGGNQTPPPKPAHTGAQSYDRPPF